MDRKLIEMLSSEADTVFKENEENVTMVLTGEEDISLSEKEYPDQDGIGGKHSVLYPRR